MHAAEKDTLIVGIGNLLMGDDGIGIHIVRELKKISLKDNVEILDGGTYGFELTPFLEGKNKIILLDAVRSDLPAGTIVQATLEELEFDEANFLSVHQQGLKEILIYLRSLNPMPEVIFYGVVAQDYQFFSTELSPQVKAGVSILVSTLKEEFGRR